ncbi:hypothetical protein [Methanoculleus taiwanensis]|uniref:hypothetical protein n=1 Tax=Methanoculleus taiwanensis TaxID=1550565 RepID=UPI000FFE6A70|nr:hypothetical protein [Methanoculleus taiwanensis]
MLRAEALVRREGWIAPYPSDRIFFPAAIIFGVEQDYLDTHIVPFMKQNGIIAVSVPGLQKDLTEGIPAVLQPFWEEHMSFHSSEWWRALWKLSPDITIEHYFSHTRHSDAWNDWLQSSNPHAQDDISMIEAENGEYFDTIGLVATVH